LSFLATSIQDIFALKEGISFPLGFPGSPSDSSIHLMLKEEDEKEINKYFLSFEKDF